MKKIEKLENLIQSLSSLPSVGKKSATRFAMHLITKDRFLALRLLGAIEEAISSIGICPKCGFLSEHEICHICADELRRRDILCIVENPKEILTIEENGSYEGIFFVLDELNDEKIEKLKLLLVDEVKEIFFALTPSIQSDAVILFVEDKLKDKNLIFTKIAQGIPTGVNIENVDMISLAKAIEQRVRA